MALGGDILEITWNHPTLGSGVIFPKSAEDSTYDLGGLRAADDANMISANGQPIHQLNNARWSFEVPITWSFEGAENTLADLVAMAGDPQDADWTFANANGTVFSGKGRPVGDLTGNGNTSMITLKVAGGGGLRKQ